MASKMGPPMSLDELLRLGSVTNVETAGRALGYSRQHSYNLIYRGEFPVPVHRVRRLYRVPTAPLLRYLGIDPTDHSPRTGNSASAEAPSASSVVKTESGKVIEPERFYRYRGRPYRGSSIVAMAQILGVAS